jgi:hypothetical protein
LHKIFVIQYANGLKGLTEDVELAGSVCVWLTKERREWLSGRYIDSRWDFDELEKKRDMIVEYDLLKFRMKVEP